MPKYQVFFDAQAGEVYAKVDIDNHETLQAVLPELLSQLQEDTGAVLKGWREGVGEPVCVWEGRELAQDSPLPSQGVRPNDVLRVGISKPKLELRREGRRYEVDHRVELHEADDLIIGNTILRFHIKDQQRATNKNYTFLQRMEQERSFNQTAYFTALIGSIAGLLCWFLSSLIVMAYDPASNTDLYLFALLGAFIGGLSVYYNDSGSGGVVPRYVLLGVLSGAAGGALGGLIATIINDKLLNSFGEEEIPLSLSILLGVIGWMTAGALIGAAVSLRWLQANRGRFLYGLLGGMAGGMLGGLVYHLLTNLLPGSWMQALALMLTGAGITLGLSYAPILLRQGVLEFINSQDPVVNNKYAKIRKQWEIHDGGKYTIGSLGAATTTTMFSPELRIFIPDQMVALRHAVLTARDRRHFIEPHPELELSRIGGRRGRE
jgi:hypothetical protein